MVVWRGSGILVAFIIVIVFLLTQFITSSITNDPTFFKTHNWLTCAALVIAGVICFFVGRLVNKKHEVYDEETGETKIVKDNNSFFFIRVENWCFILVGLGIVTLFMGPISWLPEISF
jgi:hypothetical protein